MYQTKWILKVLFYVFVLQIFSVSIVNASKKPMCVYVSGEPVGIYIRTRGLLVLGTQPVDADGTSNDPSGNRLLSGDYILKANDRELVSRKSLLDFLKKNKQKDIIFTIIRKGKKQDISVKPVYSEETGSWQIGAWIRSDTQGIGTITCICPDGSFAALGHGINDYDLGVSMEISGGSIYRADITSVVKGARKKPGEIIGRISYKPKNYLGKISYNSETGITGQIKDKKMPDQKESMFPVASASEAKKGKAFLKTSISGSPQYYAIQIEKVSRNKKDPQKTLKIHVTDSRLIRLTGGIIQGLSGSPIIMDGKLVGAVTHVLVNDPSRGYGILAEDMLDK